MIEPGHAGLSVRRQCALVGLSRSSWYYACATASADNIALCYLQAKSYEQAARELGWSKSSLALHEQRERRLLADHINALVGARQQISVITKAWLAHHVD
jgi:hypothetical protein